MSPELALEKREQLLCDGLCIVSDILTTAFLEELEEECERLIASHEEPFDRVYQGQHIVVHAEDNNVIKKLLFWEPTYQTLEELELGDFESDGSVIILTKEPKGPPLYWHQDWMQWNDPISSSPWPQIIFLNYYLIDTTLENGCLKFIPGTHNKRIDLHDQLAPAHKDGASYIDEKDPIMFCDHPDQVDVTAEAGSLVLGDARVLHSARKNLTDLRRTLILGWHIRSQNSVPENWEGDIPEVITKRDQNAKYEKSRIPGKYLK